MSELGDPSNVPALLALLAPGFIIMWFRTRVAEGATPDFKQQLILFALISAAYYGIAGPLFHVDGGFRLPLWLWSILFYAGVPVAIGIVVGWVTGREWEYLWAEKLGMRFSHRIPTAWDYRFRRVPADTFILVTLKDRTTIAGQMALGSFAASAKDGRDVYIQEIWQVMARGPWKRLEPPRGMLICGDDIQHIEFFGG